MSRALSVPKALDTVGPVGDFVRLLFSSRRSWDDATATFDHDDVTPHSMMATNAFARADDAESCREMQRKAALVLGEDA